MSKEFKAGDIVRLKQQGKYGDRWDGPLTVYVPPWDSLAFTHAKNAAGQKGAFSQGELELMAANEPNELNQKVAEQVDPLANLTEEVNRLVERVQHLEDRIAGLTIKMNRIDERTTNTGRAPGWMAGAGSVKGDPKLELKPSTYTVSASQLGIVIPIPEGSILSRL